MVCHFFHGLDFVTLFYFAWPACLFDQITVIIYVYFTILQISLSIIYNYQFILSKSIATCLLTIPQKQDKRFHHHLQQTVVNKQHINTQKLSPSPNFQGQIKLVTTMLMQTKL